MINNVYHFSCSLRYHLAGEHTEESHGGASKETHRRTSKLGECRRVPQDLGGKKLGVSSNRKQGEQVQSFI